MTYTLENIQHAPSYDALKRNGFSDIDCVAYYGTPIQERGAFFKHIKFGLSQPKPQPKVSDKSALFKQVDAEFRRLMNTTFEYNGVKYNLLHLEYSFGWNNNKSRFGVHRYRFRRNFDGSYYIYAKRIELSRYALDHSTKQFEDWVDTILHEIAHGIDTAIRGRSGHDYHWKRIAKHIGCSGQRCGSHRISEDAPSKYTIVCDNCGHERAGHKHSRVIAQGRRSCGKCNPHRYDKRYKLRQIQNY